MSEDGRYGANERARDLEMMYPWPRWMTVAVLSCYIGRTPDAIRSLVARGSIPFHRVHGRLVFGRDEIDAWVRSNGKGR